jgi:Fe2+ transport system protein B
VKIEKVKTPVVKNKVVKKPKAAPVAQNSTHEVVPEVQEEEQEITKTSKITGETTKQIVKVPVVKNVVKPKDGVVEDKDLDEEDKKKNDYLNDLEKNLKDAFSKIHKQKRNLKIKAAEQKKGTKLSNDEKEKESNEAADEA